MNRDNSWLIRRMNVIWQKLMPEIERKNEIKILFKGKWKNQFAKIKKLKDGSTEISINALFRFRDIPDFILDTTIAHELVHYMHGFQSPYPRQFKYPHQGGIVDKEMKKRGFGFLMDLEKDWIENHWYKLYALLS